MTQFYSVNFSRLPQNSSLASAGYEIVLNRGQKSFNEEQYELCCSAGFSGYKKHGDDSTVFRQFCWERDVPGCSTSWSVQTPGRSIDINFQCLPKDLFIKIETDVESHVIISFFID